MIWNKKIQFLVLSTLTFCLGAFGQSQYVVNGNANATSCDCYTLTNSQNNQVGSVWNSNLIDLNTSFDMTFDIFLGCSNNGADGMVFGLQSVGTNIGTSGGGMGMAGVSPSLGVFIDTYSNGVDFDPAADHLSIQTNGDNIHDNSPDDLTAPIILPNMEDCIYHDLQIIWDATTTQLTVLIDGTMYASIVVDLVTTVFSGNSNVYWGFAAATGGLNNEQKFCIQADLLIDVSADSICINETLTIVDSSIIAGGIVSREWDFGDGSPLSNTQVVTHSYSTPGIYPLSLSLTDVSGCVYNVVNDIVVLQPVVNQMVTNSACNACNGSIEIQATGSAAPYQYSINGGGNFQTDSIFNGLCGSQTGESYTLVVEDQFGCQNTVFDTVFDDSPEIDTVVFVNSECQINTGEVSIGTITSRGTFPYNYKVDGVSGFQPLPINNLAPNAPATYNLIVQDFFGCTDTAVVSIGVLDIPFLDSVQIIDESCYGNCDGSVSIFGVNLMNYSIDNGTNYNVSGVFNDLCVGVYDIIVNNGLGCEIFDQFTITKPMIATPLMEANITSGCEPLTVDFTNLSNGQILETIWSFSDGTSKAVAGSVNLSHEFKKPGLKDVELTVTSIDGCESIEFWPAYIDVFASPEADFTHTPYQPTIYNTEVKFNSISSKDVSAWEWSFGMAANPNSSVEENPDVYYPKGIDATYPVELQVINENGCEANTNGTVSVISDVEMYAPNVFTLGTDQNNANWRVYISGIDNYSFYLTIFNRWGEIVWESFNPNAVWDGTYNSGEQVPEGTFVWLAHSKDLITDKNYEFSGTITVLK